MQLQGLHADWLVSGQPALLQSHGPLRQVGCVFCLGNPHCRICPDIVPDRPPHLQLLLEVVVWLDLPLSPDEGQSVVEAEPTSSHEIGDDGRGRPRHALVTMNEDGTKTPTAVDEVAESGEVGKQVLCHAVSAGYEFVTVIRNDLIPGLVPLDPFSTRKRDHGDDVLVKYFTLTGTLLSPR